MRSMLRLLNVMRMLILAFPFRLADCFGHFLWAPVRVHGIPVRVLRIPVRVFGIPVRVLGAPVRAFWASVRWSDFHWALYRSGLL